MTALEASSSPVKEPSVEEAGGRGYSTAAEFELERVCDCGGAGVWGGGAVWVCKCCVLRQRGVSGGTPLLSGWTGQVNHVEGAEPWDGMPTPPFAP